MPCGHGAKVTKHKTVKEKWSRFKFCSIFFRISEYGLLPIKSLSAGYGERCEKISGNATLTLLLTERGYFFAFLNSSLDIMAKIIYRVNNSSDVIIY